MRNRVVFALAAALSLAAYSGLGAADKKKAAPEPKQFLKQVPEDQKIQQVLSRLTFGPRPGDARLVKTIGLKKWIDQQLHPDRIDENPILTEKLKYLDTLTMSSTELVANYPTPQIAKAMIDGRIPFPTDPDRKLLLTRMVEKFEKKQAAGGDPNAAPNPNVPDSRPLTEILGPREIRALRQGTPEERLAAFNALPKDKQDDVIAALPGGQRQGLLMAAPPDVRRRFELAQGPQQLVARDLMESKILHAVYGNRQLEEVLTDFWYNHFNIFLDKGADRYLVTEYERDVIRPHVLGKFKDMLAATAKSPAMLFYLDNWQSVGPNPQGPFRGQKKGAERGLNENYGRELLELHTLGVDGGYTQKDVTETARCFTGWTIQNPQRGGTFLFNPRMHDNGEKTVLGVTIPAGGGISDGEKILAIVAHHPSAAHFISKKLAQRFVADDPPEALVQRMAETFRKTDGDLRAVMLTMIESKEFFSEGAYRSKMKSPLELVASAVRAVNGDVRFALPLAQQVAQLGQPLYRKQEPTGYSNSSVEWMNSGELIGRMNFALQLTGNRVPGVKVDTTLAGTDLGSPDFQKR